MKSNKPLAPAAQASPPSSKEKSFANETPEQQARHREIAHRYRRSRRGGATRRLIANLRKAELQRIFFDRCGETLPDDDAGREYLRLMADHLAQLGANYITAYARASAPWLTDDALDGLIELVGQGKHWKKNALAKELNLDDATRTRLKIKTIGAVDRTKAQRARDCRKRKAQAEAARRAKAGAAPHALSAARLKPWLALGISESTYYRRKRQNDSGDSNSCRILLETQCCTNHCQGAPPRLTRGSEARAAADTDRIPELPRETKLKIEPLTIASSM